MSWNETQQKLLSLNKAKARHKPGTESRITHLAFIGAECLGLLWPSDQIIVDRYHFEKPRLLLKGSLTFAAKKFLSNLLVLGNRSLNVFFS